MARKSDPSWNPRKTPDGNLPADPKAFQRKLREWESRDWWNWLNQNLRFPFTAERIEDDYDAYFGDEVVEEALRLGHRMEVLELDAEEEDGITVQVREGDDFSSVPLADLQVASKKGPNYWPVREYMVWFANRE
jgi:hypothetical protein